VHDNAEIEEALRLGNALGLRYEQSGHADHLSAAIDALTTAHERCQALGDEVPAGVRAQCTARLHDLLVAKFAIDDDARVLDSALNRIRAFDDRPHRLLLATAYETYHLATGRVDDLRRGVEAARSALTLPRRLSDPLTAMALLKLGNLAETLYRYTSDQDTRVEAASAYKMASHAPGLDSALRQAPVSRAQADVYRDLLAEAVQASREQYANRRRITDLATAIVFNRRLVASFPSDGDPRLAATLVHLAQDLFERYQRTEQPERVLSEARQCATRVDGMAWRRPGDGHLLGSVAQVWLRDYETTNSVEALGRSIERALAAEERSRRVRFGPALTLGVALVHRNRPSRRGRSDADLAQDAFRRALSDPDISLTQRLEATAYLAMALRNSYERSGNPDTLGEAISLLETAVSDGHATKGTKRSYVVLSSLYGLLATATGDSGDRRRAEEAAERAASLDDPAFAHVPSPSIAHTADADLADIDRRLGELRAASPDGKVFTALCGLWMVRYRRTSDPADVDQATEAGRRAMAATARDPALAVPASAVLTLALTERYRLHGDDADIGGAIRTVRSAIARSARDDVHDPDLDALLIAALQARADRSGAEDFRQEAVAASIESATDEARSPLGRLATMAWLAGQEADRANWRAAARWCGRGVSLLPFIAPETLSRAEQQDLLRQAGRGTADGVACWLNAGDPERAAALLEQGRAFLLSRTINARTVLAGLRATHPDLAETFDDLVRQVSAADETGAEGSRGPGSIRRKAAAGKLTELTGRIRRLPGHDRFLRPPAVADLIAAASEGPLVLMNASRYRCDAIVVTQSGIHAVPLPEVSLERLVSYANQSHWRDGAADILQWLWNAVGEPVLALLDEPQRIWWIPDGLFSLMPLHAGGSMPDRVRSSYAPSVAALVRARAEQAALPEKILVVAMPTTPGLPPLRGAEAEAQLLADQFGAYVLGSASNAREQATPAAILRRLPDYAMVHFACHGSGYWIDATPPYLAVQGAALAIEDILGVPVDGARLVFLSACATARPTDLALIEQAVDLASAFVEAGYTHVVGTLWEVDDRAAAGFTAAFYEHLRRGGSPADAVHDATRTLRKLYPKTPQMWASHIHVGP